MKFKTLFLSMLGAAAIVSCNNEVIGPDGPGGGPNGPYEGGGTTHATFSFKLTNPGATFAGDSAVAGDGRENEIGNVGMFIYDVNGTPEAMAYVKLGEFSGSNVTVRCKAGTKLIYVAANFGFGVGTGTALINTFTADTTNTLSPAYMGVDWTNIGPGFSALNAPIWAAGTGVSLDTTSAGPDNIGADNLIKALTGNGDATKGILFGNGSGTGSNDRYYLMSNWGDNTSDPTSPSDNVADGSGNYEASAKHTLAERISAAESQNPSNANYIKISIQRAVAKLAVKAITSTVLNNAGTGTSAGSFTPVTSWAAGNINCSEYPFQMWDVTTVKSTRYDESTPILPATGNKRWAKKMDNTRIEPSGQSYEAQNLTVPGVLTKLATAPNVPFYATDNPVADDYILLTENNNKETYNHYTTYVLFGGQYKPTEFILSVSNVGAVMKNTSSGAPSGLQSFPASWPITNSSSTETDVDTMFYVASYGTNGLFFLGQTALLQYIAYSPDMLNGEESDGSPILDPIASQSVADEMNKLLTVSGNKQADLQKYYRGNCFYRVWVQDNSASGANKDLVRRNHAYRISISKILGPGIGDPNDIIDPDPSTIEKIEVVNTYVTAEIEIMKWHIINQETPIGL
jgi:hypothetical protein